MAVILHGEGICWLLLIFNLHNSRAKLEKYYGANSMHDQKDGEQVFIGENRSSAEGWDKKRKVLS